MNGGHYVRIHRGLIQFALVALTTMAAAQSNSNPSAVKAGVTGTPAVLINGCLLSGGQSYADLRDVIEDELQRKKRGK